VGRGACCVSGEMSVLCTVAVAILGASEAVAGGAAPPHGASADPSPPVADAVLTALGEFCVRLLVRNRLATNHRPYLAGAAGAVNANVPRRLDGSVAERSPPPLVANAPLPTRVARSVAVAVEQGAAGGADAEDLVDRPEQLPLERLGRVGAHHERLVVLEEAALRADPILPRNDDLVGSGGLDLPPLTDAYGHVGEGEGRALGGSVFVLVPRDGEEGRPRVLVDLEGRTRRTAPISRGEARHPDVDGVRGVDVKAVRLELDRDLQWNAHLVVVEADPRNFEISLVIIVVVVHGDEEVGIRIAVSDKALGKNEVWIGLVGSNHRDEKSREGKLEHGVHRSPELLAPQTIPRLSAPLPSH